MEDVIFWSEIGSGFGELGGTSPPRIPRSPPPPGILVSPGLRRRRNLTPVSNVCQAALKSMHRAPNGLKELPGVRFEFPFNLTGKLTMAFLTGQSWPALKSWYSGGGPEQEFRHCFADGLNPLGPKNDHHQFSPNNISRSSRVKVMRITK